MACRYTYKGKTYEAHEFDDVLRAMSPAEASAFMPGVKAVPSAPFVTKTDAWVALALKRVIKMAVDEGYDKVAFVTGEQSAERYDLSKQVDSITYEPTDKGYYINVMAGGRNIKNGDFSAAELEDIVGKEIVKKMEAREGPSEGTPGAPDYDDLKDTRRLSGDGLKVGGEGMKAFYDTLVPNAAKGLVKKLGGDGLGPVSIGASEGIYGISIEYDDGSVSSNTYDQVWETRAAAEKYLADHDDTDEGQAFVELLSDEDGFLAKTHSGASAFFDTKAAAEKWLKSWSGGTIKEIAADAQLEQPGFTITDKMREAVHGGLPLFSTHRNDPALESWAEAALAGQHTRDAYKKVVDKLPHPAWLMAGLDGRLPVTIDRRLVSHLRRSGHEEVTAGMIGRLASLMERPRVMIRNEGTDEAGNKITRYQALVDARDHLGRPLLVAVRKSKEGGGDVYDVRSMFGRQESMQYVLDQLRHSNVVWMADKEAAALRDFTGGSTMPRTGQKPGAQPSRTATTVIVPGDAAAQNYPNKGWKQGANSITIQANARERAEGAMFSSARWTDERIDDLLSAYAYTQNGDRTKAFAAWVNPTDYLAATTPADERERLESERTPLDAAELARQSQEIMLIGEPGDRRIFKIDGHEGRHRMMALRDAGVTSVPVVFYVRQGMDAPEPLTSHFATPQRWGHAKAEKGFLTGLLLPISYNGKKALRERFGRNAEMDKLRRQARMEPEVAFSAGRDPQTETEEFKAWFGDSKVVDESGAPLRVYTGTSKDVDFKSFKVPKNGAWFSADPKVASDYAQDNDSQGSPYNPDTRRWEPVNTASRVIPAYLRIERPYTLSAAESERMRLASNYKREQGLIFDGARARGHDGVDMGDGVWVVIGEPSQIKSAVGNNGDFDPKNKDITKSADRDEINSAQEHWASPGASKFDDLVYKMQDKHVDTKRVVEAVKATQGAIRDDLDVYLQEELFHGRAAKRTEDFVHHELQPLIDQMSEEGLQISDLDEYLHARHAREANEVIKRRNPELQDGGSGMLNQDAEAYFAELDPTKRAKLDAAATHVDSMLAKTRELLIDYQLESREKVQGWADMFKHYVPLMREDEGGHSGGGTGQGFSIKGKEVKSRTGSTRKVVDILANIAMQRERTIVRGEKNRVSQALFGLAAANPNEAFWKVDTHIPSEQVYNPKTGLVEDRPDNLYKQRPNVVATKIMDADGNVSERAVVFNEKNERAMRMAESLKNLDAAQLEGLLGASAKLTRYFASVNTQYNPVFGVVNLVRDMQGALVNLGTTEIADRKAEVARQAMSALRGIYGDLRATRKGGTASSQWAQLWEDFQAVGGQTGYRQLFATSNDRADAIKNALDPNAWMDSRLGKIFTANGALKVPLAAAQRGAKWIFDWLSDYNTAMENGVRLAAYKTALDAGLSKERAASLAKNLTVNFNRKGQVAQQAGAMYAFFNASMQGTARLGATLFEMEPGKPKTIRLSGLGKKVVYGGMLLGSMQALAMAAAGFGEDDPPEWARERSLIIPIGDKKYVTIPLPLGLHVIPNIGRVTTAWALSGFKDTPKRLVGLLGSLADAFNPIGNAGLSMQTLAPTALDPLVALTENKDWSGRPIAKESSNKAMPGHALARDTASSWSKLMSEAINTLSGGTKYTAGVLSPTPDQIDYLIGQFTGGVGRELAKVEQSGLGVVRGETVPLHKVPLVGRFVGNAKSQASEGNAFYANVDRLNELETEIKGLKKDGKTDEANQLRMKNPQAYLITQANHAERQVQKLRREKSELIKAGAPREQIVAIEARITERMAALNRAVEALKKG